MSAYLIIACDTPETVKDILVHLLEVNREAWHYDTRVDNQERLYHDMANIAEGLYPTTLLDMRAKDEEEE